MVSLQFRCRLVCWLFSSCNIPWNADALAVHLNIRQLSSLILRFLYEQENPDLDSVSLEDCPWFRGTVRVYSSACTIYYAPSDKSGTRSMFRERIRAVDSWHGGSACRDCVFVNHSPDLEGFLGLLVARVHSFLSISHDKIKYPCALVSWFSTVGSSPCPNTGMWIVEPDFDNMGKRAMSIIHLDSDEQGLP
jgi:hypothetical protein